MIHLAAGDIAVIFLYFGAVLYVGFRTARKQKATEEDFLLAGRSLTLPVFVMTLVSTWYGGILGVGEFSYRYGVSNWVIQGVPYYVFAAIFAMFLAKRVRATNLFTIPDKLAVAYDNKTAILGGVLTFILMTPAPYILMLSVFLQMLFGWSLMVSLIVTAVVAISYLYAGGFRADVETDIVEFILMFFGFAIILPFAFTAFGGMEFLRSHLPPLHLTWHGGNSMQFIIVWFFIALWTLVDPAFHQRCYAAKSGSVAQRGILVSIIFWCIFDFMTATAGLYARAALPNLADPVTAYPMLAEAILPPIAKGMFYVGMLATIMSTLNTLAFVSAQTLGRDIWLRLGGRGLGLRDAGDAIRGAGDAIRDTGYEIRSAGLEGAKQIDEKTTRYTQIGLIVTFLLSIAIALLMPSVISIWYTIGTIIIPGLLVPLMASYFPGLRMTARYAFGSMLCGWLTSVAWMIAGYTGGRNGVYPFEIEPMYPGLVMSLIWWLVGRADLRITSTKG